MDYKLIAHYRMRWHPESKRGEVLLMFEDESKHQISNLKRRRTLSSRAHFATGTGCSLQKWSGQHDVGTGRGYGWVIEVFGGQFSVFSF